MMVRNRPIVLHDGDYLLPVYHETGHDTEIVGARQHVAVPAVRPEDAGRGQQTGAHPVGEGQHPAGRGRSSRRIT